MRITSYRPKAVRSLSVPSHIVLALLAGAAPAMHNAQSFSDSLARITSAAGGRVGATFQTDALSGPASRLQDLRPNEHFPMMSVFVSDPRAGVATREGVIARIALLAYRHTAQIKSLRQTGLSKFHPQFTTL